MHNNRQPLGQFHSTSKTASGQIVKKIAQRNTEKQLLRINWRKAAGVGILSLLAGFSLAPLLPIVAGGGVAADTVIQGVASLIAGLGGNAVASWMDQTAQDWAGVNDPTEEALVDLADQLREKMAKDEDLREGIIKLVVAVEAVNVALDMLKVQNSLEFSEMKYQLLKLQGALEKINQQSRSHKPNNLISEIFERFCGRKIQHTSPSSVDWTLDKLPTMQLEFEVFPSKVSHPDNWLDL